MAMSPTMLRTNVTAKSITPSKNSTRQWGSPCATSPSSAAIVAVTVLTLFGGFASTVFWPLSHLLLEAKADDVRAQRLDNMEESVRQLMRNASPRIRIGDVSTADGKLSFMLENAADIDRARGLIEPAMQGATTVREWELQGLEADTLLIAVGGGGLIAGALAVFVPSLGYPLTYTVWFAIDITFRSPTAEDFAQAQAWLDNRASA